MSTIRLFLAVLRGERAEVSLEEVRELQLALTRLQASNSL